ncbi:protein of unknown function [Azospirillum baldaniorum]|uniref:Uncharacterized protein n=1 Tax=Azospirillum baldaniorum TaxID=1064539 RepID=A0A9P1NLA8_9PROT|nr:protein of unknown function [Azospirillum baldaniorum]
MHFACAARGGFASCDAFPAYGRTPLGFGPPVGSGDAKDVPRRRWSSILGSPTEATRPGSPYGVAERRHGGAGKVPRSAPHHALRGTPSTPAIVANAIGL